MFACPVQVLAAVLVMAECGTHSLAAGGKFETCKHRESQFLCLKDEKCISDSKRCDGVADCSDRADELGCEHWRCDEHSFTCDSGERINKHWRCDSEPDCTDESDEKDCHLVPPQECLDDEFKCKSNGFCIPHAWTCDARVDCTDESDEAPDLCRPVTTAPCAGIMCGNSTKCIPHKWICDHSEDCPGGEDEDKDTCDKMSHEVGECNTLGLFLCNDSSKCLSHALVCDGTPHCADGSDEGQGCADACSPRLKCPVRSSCAPTPQGGTCVCLDGFDKSANGRQCLDVDECKEYGKCDQTCVNTRGSYRCLCRDGYIMEEGSKACKVFNTPPILLFSSKEKIRGMELFGKTRRSFPVIRNSTFTKESIGIAFDDVNSRVYWTAVQPQNEGILSSTLSGSDIRYEIRKGIVTPEDLTIDFLGRNVYFTDSHFKHVAVMSIASKAWTPIISLSVGNPRGIAVHPVRGLLFYSVWGNHGGIMRAGMDGRDVRRIIPLINHEWLNGVAVDVELDRIFWSEAKNDLLESANFDGSDRRPIYVETARHPFSIAVFEDRLYWSDWETKEIRFANKFSGKNDTVLFREPELMPMGITVHHPLMDKRPVVNPCARNQCSHMCLLNKRQSFTCACPQGMTLTDGTACACPAGTTARGNECETVAKDKEEDEKYVYVSPRLFPESEVKDELDREEEESDDPEKSEEKFEKPPKAPTPNSSVANVTTPNASTRTNASTPYASTKPNATAPNATRPNATTPNAADSREGTVRKSARTTQLDVDSLVIGIVVAILLLLIVILGLYCFFRRRKYLAISSPVTMRFRNPAFGLADAELKNVGAPRKESVNFNYYANPFTSAGGGAASLNPSASDKDMCSSKEAADGIKRSATNPYLNEMTNTSTPALIHNFLGRSNTMESQKSMTSSNSAALHSSLEEEEDEMDSHSDIGRYTDKTNLL